MTITSAIHTSINAFVRFIFDTSAAKFSGRVLARPSIAGDPFVFEGTVVSDVVSVLSPSDESLNPACTFGLLRGDIVFSHVGLKSGSTRRAESAKQAGSKNINHETWCNKLGAGRQVEMASDGGAGSIIVSKSSGKPIVSQDIGTASVSVLGANELMHD